MTTDVAALMREMRDLADRIVECQGENSEGEEIINLYDESDTTFKAQNVLLVLDAFKAAEARVKELTSEQEPVAWIHQGGPFGGAVTRSLSVANSWKSKGDDVTELFTAAPKPVVVLPEYYPAEDCAGYNVFLRGDVQKAIEAAGGVKDGE